MTAKVIAIARDLGDGNKSFVFSYKDAVPFMLRMSVTHSNLMKIPKECIALKQASINRATQLSISEGPFKNFTAIIYHTPGATTSRFHPAPRTVTVLLEGELANDDEGSSFPKTKQQKIGTLIFNCLNREIELEDIAKDLELYTHNSGKELVKAARELDATKRIMRDNMEKVLERDDRLETLVATAEELKVNADVFYKKAKKLNDPGCWPFSSMCTLL